MKPDDFGIVSGAVPSLFEAYVAIRHPAWLHNCTAANLRECQGDPAPGTSITWLEVVDSDLPICIRDTQYRKLENVGWVEDKIPEGDICLLIQVGDRWISGPAEGALEPAQVHTLLPLLMKETSDPENCWFGIWSGFAFRSTAESGAATFDTPNRSWYLYRGPLQSIDKSFDDSDLFHHPANFVWPDDRSWCLGSDIDSEATYIGGSDELIDTILNNPSLDAISVVPSDRPVWLANLLQPVVEKPADATIQPGFESRANPFIEQIKKIHEGQGFRRYIRSLEFHWRKKKEEDGDESYFDRR